jgi:hypothetical protein
VTELVTEYKGAMLTHVYKGPPISVTAAVDHSMKLEYEGPLCIDFLTRSYKYGEQAQLIVYQKNEPRAVFRQADSRDWYRIESHIPVAEFDALCFTWLRYRGLIP